MKSYKICTNKYKLGTILRTVVRLLYDKVVKGKSAISYVFYFFMTSQCQKGEYGGISLRFYRKLIIGIRGSVECLFKVRFIT